MSLSENRFPLFRDIRWVAGYQRCPPAQPDHGAFVIRVARGTRTIMSNVSDRSIAQKTTQILRPRATAWNLYRRDHVVEIGVGRMGSRRSAHGKGLAPLPADGNHRPAGGNGARCATAPTAARAGIIAPDFGMR